MALTNKQIRFCHEYVKDNNAEQAMIRVGYTPANARTNQSRLKAKEGVAALIAKLQAELRKKMQFEAVDAMLAFDVESNKPDCRPADRIRCLEGKARIAGLFTDRVVVEKRVYEEMSDAELDAKILKQEEEAGLH